METKVIEYNDTYKKDYTKLITTLWDDIEESEIEEIIETHENTNDKIFLAIINNEAVAFLNSAIRTDYVEGCDSSPTGYIEGIFVKEEYRKHNIGRKLLEKTFEFYKSLNIKEVGSDTELENTLSDTFHKSVGFEEVGINRHYLIKL